MTDNEWRALEIQKAGQMRIMKNDLPAPVEQRLEWLEADSAAHRTAILKLEQEVKRLRIGGAVVAAVAGYS